MSSPHCITTYRGISFDVRHPAAESILAEDIAHALSLMCRAGGHFVRFYSVAQHAINCCREAHARGLSERVQLAALLHDASEAYIADITRPVKTLLPEYHSIENVLEQRIFDKFGIGDLSEDERDRVREIDNAMLAAEFRALHAAGWPGDAPEMKATLDFACRDMAEVETQFMNILHRLLGHGKKSEKEFTAIGIDACNAVGVGNCKYGWVAVILSSEGYATIKPLLRIIDVLEIKADAILIDIPIGFTDVGNDERPGDKRTRKMVGKRASSVFPVPCRKAIYAASYDEANALNKTNTGRGLSKQSWAIVPKIREVDEFLREQPHMRDQLRESHPELCFTALRGKPCDYSKKTTDGQTERIAILDRYIDTEELLAQNPFKKKDAGVDDILDAAALAVIGLLGLTHGFRTLPENPPTDSEGLTMQMTLANLRDNAL
jgi:predicted RNase H-like nuclease